LKAAALIYTNQLIKTGFRNFIPSGGVSEVTESQRVLEVREGLVGR
jgi:hypothetical protein